MSDVTRILEAAQQGDPNAADQLLPLVYDELRRLAAHRMAHEAPGQTLQPTALVHEAWLRLVGNDHQKWDGRGHFFAAAAEAMRRILIENARRKQSLKHGGEWQRIHLTTLDVAITPTKRVKNSCRNNRRTRFVSSPKNPATRLASACLKAPSSLHSAGAIQDG